MFDTYRGTGRPARTSRTIRTVITTLLAAAAITGTLAGTAAAAPPNAPAEAAGLLGELTGPLALPHGPGTAIVVLGYGLLPDGSMRPELVERLRAGYTQALLAPLSPVIVTGGNPRNGVTEAGAMADWLVQRGIAPRRVYREDSATTTAQNAERTAPLLRALGAHDAVVVTSEDHIVRAARSFADAGIPVAATLTPRQIPEFAAAFAPGL
ncbi:YdcF family protein [Nocardia sp. NBC_00416]|uniref:YdcF family protein n=1 Tax=Nocardia sp. NBC_00416 TaxID=2975991 RepID=UPI002E20BC9D